VDALGQHRRRAGDAGGDEFRDRDAEVGGERAEEDDVVADTCGEVGQRRGSRFSSRV
jgi:hypothetical protein